MMFIFIIYCVFFLQLSCHASEESHFEKISRVLDRARKPDVLTSTQLFKDIEAEVAQAPHVSEESLKEVCNTLAFIELARRAHAQAIELLPNKQQARSKTAIALINDLAIDTNDPLFDKTAYIERAKDFSVRFPKKFNKFEKLMASTGFTQAQSDLTDHFEALPKAAPDAFKIISTVLNQKKIHTIGQLVLYAAPTIK